MEISVGRNSIDELAEEAKQIIRQYPNGIMKLNSVVS